MINTLLACLMAYLIGMIPLSKKQRSIYQDDRSAFRTMRLLDILPILMIEICKGALAVVIAWLIGGAIAAHLAVICVVLGELCPLFPSRTPRSGWGVAAGAFLVISPVLILISLLVYLLSLLLTRYYIWSTLFACVAFMISLAFFAVHFSVWLIVICVAGMLVIQRPQFWHRKGWKRRPWWRR